jgi:RNA polymerase sigma-70 factor (ECF subfamily)
VERLFLTTPSQDIALFNALKQGNKLALSSLFKAYYASLCSFAFQYLRNKEEAEEVVSDVYFNLWNSRSVIQIEKSVKAYLFTSVRNASIQRIKKRQPLFENVEDVLMSRHEEGVNPQQKIEYVELHNHYQRAVERLPARCKEIFLLSRVDNLRYNEISELLSISEKTVEGHMINALSKLRESMQHYLREWF